MENELTLHWTDEAFEPVAADADVTLQRLLGNADADGEEPEDISDVFDSYQYENPAQ